MAKSRTRGEKILPEFKPPEKLCPYPDDIKLEGHRRFVEVIAELTDKSRSFLSSYKIEDEKSELILEQLSIITQTETCIKNRKKDLVYEDHFNQSILDMSKTNEFSFQRLIDVCKKYEHRQQYAEHGEKCEKNYISFVGKSLSIDDAKASAFAIAFYTGSASGGISRSASLIARKSNGEALESIKEGHLEDAAIILYYLVNGLANIPYYWGVSTRAIDASDDDLRSYVPGSLITWLQFSSSKVGYDPPRDFAHRNAYFIIYSLTGRHIREFSIFPDEDEVLFLPHSTFIVLDHKQENNRNIFYLRQVELGFSEWSVLWVDDHILDPFWQNKSHMERAATRSLNLNVHFIPKSNTDAAISFLQSPFGQRLKNNGKFRIVTDMKRDNEPSPSYAGIRLVKNIRKLGFENECLIFTASKSKADEKIQAQLTNDQTKNLTVTEYTDDLDRFVGFGTMT